jgi:hypothetical protein
MRACRIYILRLAVHCDVGKGVLQIGDFTEE